ncbi:MAG: peptidoglycan editing factor PgeF [Oscillibacter sp.]|nr:peptidoglycan editing factor PgeF [Oscillibacter sp.]
MSFHTHEANGLVWLTADTLTGVAHGFSTRKGGVSPAPFDSLNLRTGCDDSQENLAENYRRFCAVIGTDVERVVLAKQVHETTVRLCTSADAGKGLWSERDYTADALITNETNLPLAVFSADCGIILLHDPTVPCIGAVHAGWRGCAGGIVEKAVRAMTEHFGADPARIRAAVGPSIGQCCFETDADVPEAMLAALGKAAEHCIEKNGVKYHVDLAGLNRLWLLRSGLTEEHIDMAGVCTGCHPELYWSHRKMGEARGVQCAMISL